MKLYNIFLIDLKSYNNSNIIGLIIYFYLFLNSNAHYIASIQPSLKFYFYNFIITSTLIDIKYMFYCINYI